MNRAAAPDEERVARRRSRNRLGAAVLTVAASAIVAVALLGAGSTSAAAVAVRYSEGITHGFLALRQLDGTHLADGDLIQNARADEVTSRMVLRFEDGSIHDETAVFSQRGRFRLKTHHLLQKGPAFPRALDVSIDVPKGLVTVRDADDRGKEQILSEHIELPDDLANGMVVVMIKNIGPRPASSSLSMVATSPKPRLVRLAIAPAGEEPFAIGGSPRKAVKFVVKVELGGVAGLVAPLIGKQPEDTFVWIAQGEAPTFVKSEGPLYAGGPSWRLELATPSWPK